MKRVALATAAALLAASAVFVALVLPAEFGVDPSGAGRALGLLGLSGRAEGQYQAQPGALVGDRREFDLAPFESVELKYHLAAGRGLVYSWNASGDVVFDLHAEPAGAAPGYAESFAQGRGTADSGIYKAPYDGIHGWFWENRGAVAVVVQLETAGFATAATVFAAGRSNTFALEKAGDRQAPQGVE